MKKIKQILRWTSLIGFILFGLLFLKNAFLYSLVSSSATSACPLESGHRSIVHLGYGLASISTSVMLFIALKSGFDFRASKLKYVWLVVVSASFLYPEFKEWLEIDRCLDSGGEWSPAYFECLN